MAAAIAERRETFRSRQTFSAAALGRGLLHALACGGTCRSSSRARAPPAGGGECEPRSERLAELLDAEAAWSAHEEMRRVVAGLGGSRRREAAADVRRLAKDDGAARETLAALGAIPVLVSILAAGDDGGEGGLLVETLYALLNLGIGNDKNKADIVGFGAVDTMLKLVARHDGVGDAVVANFLSLSALDENKTIIGASGAVPFLGAVFQRRCAGNGDQARQDALRALFNISIVPDNGAIIAVAAGLVPALVAAIGDMSVTDRALAMLSNLVASGPEGRRAVAQAPDALAVLIDVLLWGDAPECQENAAYVLMVMAHKGSHTVKAAMVDAGITSALLELALVGTTIAQKRASRTLEILRADKGKQPADMAMSAPQEMESAMASSSSGGSGGVAGEERRALRRLVQQSLQSNMRRIMRRARLPGDTAPRQHLTALSAGSSTSKSLPF